MRRGCTAAPHSGPVSTEHEGPVYQGVTSGVYLEHCCVYWPTGKTLITNSQSTLLFSFLQLSGHTSGQRGADQVLPLYTVWSVLNLVLNSPDESFSFHRKVLLWLATPLKQVQVCYCSLCPVVTIEAEQDCTKLLSLTGCRDKRFTFPGL